MVDIIASESITNISEINKDKISFPYFNTDNNPGNNEPSKKATAFNAVYATLTVGGHQAGELADQLEQMPVSEISSNSLNLYQLIAHAGKTIKWIDQPGKNLVGELSFNFLQQYLKTNQSNSIKNAATLDPDQVEEHIEFSVTLLNSLMHDLNGALLPILNYTGGSLPFDDRSIGIVRNNLSFIKEQIAREARFLSTGEYDRMILNADGLTDKIGSFLKTSAPVDFQISIEGLAPRDKPIEVMFNDMELSRIMINLLRNSEKIYSDSILDGDEDFDLPITNKKIFGVVFRISGDQLNGEYLEIIFYDRGRGYPKQITATGRFDGISRWDKPQNIGTGGGLKYHQKLVEEQFNGELIPSNNEDGGAKTILRLPITK